MSLLHLSVTNDCNDVVADSGAHPNWLFNFEVKFYPLDAAVLHEDTRCD